MNTVSLIVIKPLIHYLESIGISKNELFKKATMDPKITENPDYRLNDDETEQLNMAAYHLSNDETIGLKAGQNFRFSSLGLFGYFMENSETGGDVFKKLMNYQEIIGNGIMTRIEYSSNSFTVYEEYLKTGSLITQRICIDKIFSQIIAGVRLLTGEHQNPFEVRYAFPEPKGLEVYGEVFKCPILFNQEEHGIVLNNELLDFKIQTYDSRMENYFNDLAGKELENTYSSESFANKVGRFILRNYPYGNVEAEQIASEFNLGLRTFQRRLKNENSSFKEIIDGIKKSIALNYVESNQMSLSEISYMLGFSEISSFYRTFKRWTGKTPKVHRESTLAHA